MKCIKCGRETEDNVYTCLEIVKRTTEKQLTQAVTGIGQHAICQDCVNAPLPRFVGDLFRKKRPDAVKSMKYWYQVLNVAQDAGGVTENVLWPLEKDVLEEIAAEKKQDDRIMKFIKTGQYLELSPTFKSILYEKFFEPGKWREAFAGTPLELDIET